jgi:hypothetical protein
MLGNYSPPDYIEQDRYKEAILNRIIARKIIDEAHLDKNVTKEGISL